MQKLIETVNNMLKLATTLVTLSVLGAVVYGGLWAYRTAAEFTSKPLQMPAIEVPPIKVAMPEVTLPDVNLPDFGPKEESFKDGFWGWKDAQRKEAEGKGGFWSMK